MTSPDSRLVLEQNSSEKSDIVFVKHTWKNKE
jgi:hypothetical protein